MKNYRPDRHTGRMIQEAQGGWLPSMVSGETVVAFAAAESWHRARSVESWCGKYRPVMKRLSRAVDRRTRRYGARMLALVDAVYRTCQEILANREELLDQEVAACEAAGERPDVERWEEGDEQVFEGVPDGALGWAAA